MTTFAVDLVFATGDPETVCAMGVKSPPDMIDAAQALNECLSMLRGPYGFTPKDIVQVIVTRVNHGVAENLLPFQPSKGRAA